MYKTLTILAILGMGAVSRAAIFTVDCQPDSGTPVAQPGMEIMAGASDAASITFTTTGGETITLTPSADAGGGKISVTDKKTDSDNTGQPRAAALFDDIRVHPTGDHGDPNNVPVMQVEITGLAAGSLYGLRIGCFNTARDMHQLIRPTGGTAGAVVQYVATNPPIPSMTDVNDKSYVLSYTTDALGKLTFDIVWDKAAWVAAGSAIPVETAVWVAYMELVPEPATLSLLALSGLAAVRRRRR